MALILALLGISNASSAPEPNEVFDGDFEISERRLSGTTAGTTSGVTATMPSMRVLFVIALLSVVLLSSEASSAPEPTEVFDGDFEISERRLSGTTAGTTSGVTSSTMPTMTCLLFMVV